MRSIEVLDSLDAIKILADSRRLEILRLLMAAPATLTQLGRRLQQSPAWVRHHLEALQHAGLAELHEVRTVGRATEKYYRASSGALLIEQLVLPKARLPVIVFSGSHDPALQAAADQLGARSLFLARYVGSLNGLTNLRQGVCHLTGIHLLDHSGEYNTPFVRHFFADQDVESITLAYRTQGLMLAPGNPRSIRRIQDLARPGVRFVNRNPGSGTRLWLDRELHSIGVGPDAVSGYKHQVSTHTQAAWWIKTRKADAALGLQAAAHESGLDFVPLFEERYDLVLPLQAEKILAPLLNLIQSATFRTSANSMTGYSTTHSGEFVKI
ncbi:MAG TPA: substrate-binding domain-containing protein [Anaerolineales bacterium]